MTHNKKLNECDGILPFGKCMRLYNKDGKHVFSVVRCIYDDGFDFCTPDGNVFYCDCRGENTVLWKTFNKYIPIEDIKKNTDEN